MAVKKGAKRARSSSSAVSVLKAGQGVMAPALPSSLQQKYGADVDATRAMGTVAAGGWPFFQTEGGTFKEGSGKVYGDEINVIVVAAARGNFLYEGKYDPNKRGAVKCFALSELDAEFDVNKMAPPSDLATKAAERCLGCPNDRFGSDDRGKGKACRNYVILAVLPADEEALADPSKIRKLDGARIRIPPTSMGQFGKYARFIAEKYERPLFTVSTRLFIVKHPTHQFEIQAEESGYLQSVDLIEAIAERRSEARDQVMAAPPISTEESAPEKARSTKRRRASGV